VCPLLAGVWRIGGIHLFFPNFITILDGGKWSVSCPGVTVIVCTGWRTKCHTIDCARNTFLLLQNHLTSGTELILIGWKIVPNEEQARKCRAAQGPHSEVVPRAF